MIQIEAIFTNYHNDSISYLFNILIIVSRDSGRTIQHIKTLPIKSISLFNEVIKLHYDEYKSKKIKKHILKYTNKY